jgi:hypothetical protein
MEKLASSNQGSTFIKVYEPTRKVNAHITTNDVVCAKVQQKLYHTHGFTEHEIETYIKPYCSYLKLWCKIKKDVIEIIKNGITAYLKKIDDQWILWLDILPKKDVTSIFYNGLKRMKHGKSPDNIFDPFINNNTVTVVLPVMKKIEGYQTYKTNIELNFSDFKI